ncbi:aminomethyltransferase family protein [Enhygromyxa salina]|uniref:Aminomethyltransferase n=1 Tax=Enhygromyxa salina TaxID=215803 RepID=A0A2S9YW07_9BACT|nr:aminomethyltransferase family protein [Enhygromyxa salina]PRQ09229.1 Aminomethyltransferase [Enhygromyxa salina]
MGWVRGEHAYEVVEALCPRDLFVRSGRVLHALVLDEAGGIEADLLVCPRDQAFLLIADGLDDAGLLARLQAHAPAGAQFELEAVPADRTLFGLSGPYAWELIAALLGPELSTLRYLSCIALPELADAGELALCLRVGSTGEYGYELLLPPSSLAQLEAKLVELGPRFDLCEVDQAVLDRAALENGFFCPRHRGVLGRSPLQLALQWRVAFDLDYRGVEGLRAARDRGVNRRLSWMIGRLEAGAATLGPLRREGAEVGELLEGFVSPVLGCFVGIALVDGELAHPWIAEFHDAAGHELQTAAPPLLQNRSLFVDPKKHTYAFRAEDRGEFPPIVPGGAVDREPREPREPAPAGAPGS